MTAQLIDGLDGLAALEPEWRRLFAGADCEPAMSFEWTQALARTQLKPGDETFLALLRRGPALVGVVPLFLRATHVFKQRHLIVRPLAELKNTHSDLLLADDRRPEILTALFAALRGLGRRWDSLRLSKLVEGHALTPQLEEQAGGAGFTPRRRFRKPAYWLPLPASFADYLAGRSSKFRNYARRAEKKLRAAGRLEVVEITSPAEFEAGYEALMHVERASWKATHGTSISAVSSQAALYREWGRAVRAADHLHLQLLTLDGEPIAHNLGCIHRGIYYYLKTSYAAQHRPLSPATFLRLALVEAMIARRLVAIDFCGTPYEWERQWTETYRWHHVLSVYAGTWRGRLLSMLDPWTHYSSSGTAIVHAEPRDEGPPTP